MISSRTSSRDAIARVGAATIPQPAPAPVENESPVTFGRMLSIAGAASGAYHGYKRNDSIGWAVGWALLGATFPIVTIPVSIAQGFGEPAK